MYTYTSTGYRQPPPRRQTAYPPPPTKKKHHHGLIVAVLFFAIICALPLMHTHAQVATQDIRSGIAGKCLDDYQGLTKMNTKLSIRECNGTTAQGWVVTTARIIHDNTYCLSVQGNGVSAGSHVVLNHCDQSPGQVWLRDRSGFENPNSGMCLSVLSNSAMVGITPCHTMSEQSQQWTAAFVHESSYTPTCDGSTEGDRIACAAEQQWSLWQTGSPSHTTLLNQYTDGNGYEEWCADFVSYVYKQAGHPFTQGERNGWDEYNANVIQYLGFRIHPAGSGYIPRTGDIAYFNYAGGHVEIVIRGGTTPTFIYGNSGTIDPATGNGDMEANTITNDGELGQVIYYLSPTN